MGSHSVHPRYLLSMERMATASCPQMGKQILFLDRKSRASEDRKAFCNFRSVVFGGGSEKGDGGLEVPGMGPGPLCWSGALTTPPISKDSFFLGESGSVFREPYAVWGISSRTAASKASASPPVLSLQYLVLNFDNTKA